MTSLLILSDINFKWNANLKFILKKWQYCHNVQFLGHCVEFNTGGGVIQDQMSAPCNSSFPKCDDIYHSTDAYKCNVYKKKFLLRYTCVYLFKVSFYREYAYSTFTLTKLVLL